jgi:SpoVK/Ycf46/Vps4 family AAA+-type ATPase
LSSSDSSVLLPGSIAPPSGILFHGPSGCGKTLATSCIGSSLGLPVIKVRAADVLDKWMGGSEAAIRSMFTQARAAAPCILFFDEIDAVASNRANAQDGATANIMSRLLFTLLDEMDGVLSGSQAQVLVVACTNRLETLDAALLRPGRLEEHILLDKPLLDDARDIPKRCLARAPLHDSVDIDKIAQALVDSFASGADIEGVCREAVFRALRRCPSDPSHVFITPDDIAGAVVVMKLE